MITNIKNKELMNQIEYIKNNKNFKLFDSDLNICFETKDEFSLSKNNLDVTVTYYKKSQIFKALFLIEAHLNEPRYSFKEGYKLNNLGVMIDCARNAALNINTVKRLIVDLALIGYDSLQLYFEDCIEVLNEPLIGYMRPKYTISELQDIDYFASLFGIEVIPCIQTLAHYNQIFRYREYQTIKDIDDILLAGDDRTYEFLDNVFKTMRLCFRTDKININMDEAMNIGRGKYYDLHGEENHHEVFIKHKNKVLDIAYKYRFKPMMWSDMYFRSKNNNQYYVFDKDNNLKFEKETKDVGLIYWDYYHTSKDVYDIMFKLHKKITDNIIFAGGIWTWRGYLPCLNLTETTMNEALSECKHHKIKDIFFTVWGDNGNECFKSTIMSSLIYLESRLKDERFTIKEVNNRSLVLLGYKYNEFLKLDSPNYLNNEEAKFFNSNPTKYLLYMDPLLSIFDKQLKNKDYKTFFLNEYKMLNRLSKRDNMYSNLFKNEANLCRLLAYKAPLNLKLKNAYDSKDKTTLKECLEDTRKAIKYLKTFKSLYEEMWKDEYKPSGLEVVQIRLGGVYERLEYLKNELTRYLNNPSYIIQELELDRMDIYYSPYETKNGEILMTEYEKIATTNKL